MVYFQDVLINEKRALAKAPVSSIGLAFTVTTAITFPTTFLINEGGLAAFRAEFGHDLGLVNVLQMNPG